MMSQQFLSQELIDEIKKLNHIHITWEQYALLLLNSTADPQRTIWRKKLISSIITAEFKTIIISENNLAGLEILSVLPNEFTKKIVDDVFEFSMWKKSGRIAGSKKMQVCLGHYPQESLSNEANLCIKYIIEHWDKYGYLIFEIPLLKRIWDFAQMSNGNCLYPDEVLTYCLERKLDPNAIGNWIDACIDIYSNGIPSDKFRRYYFCDKYNNWDKENDKLLGFPFETNPDIEIQKRNMLDVCDIMLKEDITGCPSWKRICICILKQDTGFRYAGFAPTLYERIAREQAMAAFAKKKEERDKALSQLRKLLEERNRINDNYDENI